MNPLDYLGPNTLARVKDTKMYMLAHFLDQLLYAATEENRRDAHGKKIDGSWVFQTVDKAYIGPFPKHLDCIGREGEYVRTAEGLREIMHVLEMLAIKEVT